MEWIRETACFGTVISLLFYQAGVSIRKRFPYAICNPLLISIIFTICFLKITQIPYEVYKEDTQIISYFLTPATVCLAIPLYEQIALLRKHKLAVLGGIFCGCIISMSGILLFSLLFSLSHEQYVTLLPKSITTAIGMGLTEELGGNVTITVASIIITGIFGNVIGETVCRVSRICHPIAKGLALGTSAHAIGTVKAFEIGEVEGAMSSLSIAVAGLITVVLASFYAGIYG